MITRLAACLALTLLLFLIPPSGDSRTFQPALTFSGPSAPGEVIVRLKPPYASLPDAQLTRLLKHEIATRMPELDSVRLHLTEGETPTSAAAQLNTSRYVAFAEPDLLLRSTLVPTDPYYTAQGAYLGLIEAPQAWDIELGKESVLVAVLDSGIDLDHVDLKNKIWTNMDEIPGNGIDDDDDGCIDDVHGCSFITSASVDASCTKPSSGVVDDDNGHGTFVSGIIAAQGNNGIGVIGTAPGVTILPIKILDCQAGGTASQAAQALLYAAKLGARVANVSFGADGESMTLANAIREAHNKYGMVIVAATGNSGKRGVTFPARLPETIAVASSGTPVDPFERSPYSEWGPEVDVAAPGLNVVSTVPPKFCDTWGCADGQPYAIASGTSFAAPIVSGLAALIISHTPNLSADGVTRLITSTAQPLPDGDTPNWDGAGRIRMRAALVQPRYTLGVAGVTRN